MYEQLRKKLFFRTNKLGPLHPILNTRCWVWTGRTCRGYGVFQVKQRVFRVHRVSWELDNLQKVPDGLCVLHKCDNPVCVNPEHLSVGTREENNIDRSKKGRNGGHLIKGEENGSAVLNEEQVRAIRKEYKKGSRTHGGTALGKKYGVKQVTISAIITRKTWNHLSSEL